MPSTFRRRAPRRDSRPALHPQRDAFHEAEGEAEADLAREEILNGTPDADAQASALERADGQTRERAVQQMQREHGNAYVQRVVARRRASSGTALVQRDDKTKTPTAQPPTNTPGAQPATTPGKQAAANQTWLQPLPSTMPRINVSAPAFATLGSTITGHPYIGAMPNPTPEELKIVQDANDYFESSPLEPWERSSGEHLQERNRLTNMFEKKAYHLTLYTLEESEKQAGFESFRYDTSVQHDNPDTVELREAAKHLGEVQFALLNMLNELELQNMPTDMQRYSEPHKLEELEAYVDDPALLTNTVFHGQLDDYTKPQKEKFDSGITKYKALREIYGQRFPVLLGKNMNYPYMAYAPDNYLSAYVQHESQEVLNNIQKVRKEFSPSKVWALPMIIEQTKKLLGIEEGTGANDAILGKQSDDAWDKMVRSLAITALQIGLQVVAAALTAGTSLAVRAAAYAVSAGAAYMTSSMAGDEYENVKFLKATSSRTSLDAAQRLSTEEPGYFWLAVDIAFMILDIAAAAKAFRAIVTPLKAAEGMGDALKVAESARQVGKAAGGVAEATETASRAARTLSLAEVEEIVRAQARMLKPQLAKASMTEDIFVERIMSGLRRQVASKGAAAEHEASVLARVIEGSHPNFKGLVSGERNALTALLMEHGDWKSLIRGLERGGHGEIAKHLVELRSTIMQEIAADLKAASKDGEALSVSPMKGGTEESISDIDIQIGGSDAGAMMARAESVMAERFGSNWSEMFRLNFYTEGGRLTRYQEALSLLKPAQKAGMTRRITQQAERFNFARMLEHAGTDPAALTRVESMAERMGVNLEELRPLAELDDTAKLTRRNALLLEVDELEARYAAAKGAEKAELAEQITTKQMEANFYTHEANIGPGSIKMSGVAGLEKMEAYQAALTQLEMIEHILAQSGGDVARASREYELYKYIGRFSEVAEKAGIDTAKLKYLRNQSKTISGTQRELAEETAHAFQDETKMQRAGVTDVPQAGKELPPVTDDFLKQNFEMFMEEADGALSKLNSNAPRRPPPPIAPPRTRSNAVTAPMKAVDAGEVIEETGIPKLINRSTPERYLMVDAEHKMFSAVGHIESGGELSLQIRTEKDGLRSEVLRGADEFKEILNHFEGRVKSIRGAWNYGTNLEKFNELVAAGKSAEEAALGTWTGQQAVKAGFGKVTIRQLYGKPGAYDKVFVLFTK
jgi:hypothetical protein